MSKQIIVPDELLISAVLKQGTIIGAAKQLNMSARTVYTRMHNPRTRLLYESIKADMLRTAVAAWEDAADDALETQISIMQDLSISDAIRLQASQYLVSNVRSMKEDLRKAEAKIDILYQDAAAAESVEVFFEKHKDFLTRKDKK